MWMNTQYLPITRIIKSISQIIVIYDECPICYQNKTPLFTSKNTAPCGHSICDTCWQNLYKNAAPNFVKENTYTTNPFLQLQAIIAFDQKIKCPNCRTGIFKWWFVNICDKECFKKNSPYIK